MCKRGEIYLVNFGSNINSCKQCGSRPAIIVSNNKANRSSSLVTVVPLTTKLKKLSQPTHVILEISCVEGILRRSMVLAEQVLTIDKQDLIIKLGEVIDSKSMKEITRALEVQIGANESINVKTNYDSDKE